ncbi:MAG: 4Fe-4S dicluster domain-containing protein [Ignavibacteria bacterium]|nr:4Fe-4S dicluster domain-containing protein [Ignavibacteria bacterium]
MPEEKKIEAKKPRKIKGKTEIHIQRCKGCELCITACPEGAISMSKGLNNFGYRYAVIVDDLCTGCANCAVICPDAAIKVYRTSAKKKKQLVAEISKVQGPVKITIDNPVKDDLSKMDYI